VCSAAELAAVRQPHGGLEVGHTAALRAGLEDPFRLANRLVQGLAPGDGEAAGLLAVDVLARSRRQDRGRGVPAVAGGDEHGVDVAPGQQLVEVAVGRAVLVLVMPVHELLTRVAAAGLHVANRQAVHVGQPEHRLEVVGAARADPDDAEGDAPGGGDLAVATERGRGHEQGGRQHRSRRRRLPQQVTPRQTPIALPIVISSRPKNAIPRIVPKEVPSPSVQSTQWLQPMLAMCHGPCRACAVSHAATDDAHAERGLGPVGPVPVIVSGSAVGAPRVPASRYPGLAPRSTGLVRENPDHARGG
jgi:hypothetical protein